MLCKGVLWHIVHLLAGKCPCLLCVGSKLLIEPHTRNMQTRTPGMKCSNVVEQKIVSPHEHGSLSDSIGHTNLYCYFGNMFFTFWFWDCYASWICWMRHNSSDWMFFVSASSETCSLQHVWNLIVRNYCRKYRAKIEEPRRKIFTYF